MAKRFQDLKAEINAAFPNGCYSDRVWRVARLIDEGKQREAEEILKSLQRSRACLAYEANSLSHSGSSTPTGRRIVQFAEEAEMAERLVNSWC